MKRIDDRLKELITLGRGHYLRGDHTKALVFLKQVVEREDTFADIHNMIGVIYHAQNNPDEAAKCFEKALEINPNYTEASLNLSVTYNDLGHYEKATKLYQEAIGTTSATIGNLDPYAAGKIANMHAELGVVYQSFGRMDDAIREFRKALEHGPGFADIRTRLGKVLRDTGKLEEAVSEFEAAKKLRPEYIEAALFLGITYFSMGRVEDAVREWQAVLLADPYNKSAEAYLRIANAKGA